MPQRKDLDDVRISDIMTREVATTDSSITLEEAVKKMNKFVADYRSRIDVIGDGRIELIIES